MIRPRTVSPQSVIAIVIAFAVVVGGNVMTNGLGRPLRGRLVAACVVIALAVAIALWRVRQFQRLDELHQRLTLESLATAFVGSFLVFVAYWLLQAAGLLPPLIGTYYALGMVALASLGSGRAWRRLRERPPTPR